MPAGTSTSVSVIALTPCPTGTYAWSVIAKQANNFSGDPGNDLTFDAANSALTTSLTGTCHLGFDFVSQPASAQAGAAITTVTYDPAAPPVAVQVLDGGGSLISSSTASVMLTILNNAGGGFLSGTTTVNAIGGVAMFPGISIDQSGLNYTLAASTATVAIDPGASAPFNIADVGKQCSAGPCSSGTVTDGGTSASELASGGAFGDAEPLRFGRAARLHQLHRDVRRGDVRRHGFEDEEHHDQRAKASSQKPSKVRVCFSSPTAFVSRSGATVNLGLLPDCGVRRRPASPPSAW